MRYPAQRSIPATLAAAFALSALLTVLTPWAAAQRSGHAAFITPQPHCPQPIISLRTERASLRISTVLFPARFSPVPVPRRLLQSRRHLLHRLSRSLATARHPATTASARALLRIIRPSPQTEPATTTQPLMIELQNGRYVRVASTPANGEALPLTIDKKPAAASTAPNPPPALLIFRDGHSEEVRDYAIADGILYARGDYYATDTGTKRSPSPPSTSPDHRSQHNAQSKIHPANISQRSNHPTLAIPDFVNLSVLSG